jgi:hypothetical protein
LDVEFTRPWHELAGQLRPELKFTNHVRSVNFLMREQACGAGGPGFKSRRAHMLSVRRGELR